ncbi:MAG: flagellar hook-associated protein FlgK [Clostridiales bacterium]|nr:flagellar hook-associated protein FlgK [Clostridiales bacterium]
MAVGFASYEIARSGLTYNERALDVTGHNIANVNTKGYSRQQAVAEGSFYIRNNAKYGYGQVGTGVDVQQTRQIRHKFLDNIYRYENAKADYWSVRLDTYSAVENVMREPVGEGLQSLMNQFWNAWQELSKDPSSLTARSLVRQLGESISFQANNIGAQFDEMQASLDSQFTDAIKLLGELCGKVAKLNAKIKEVQIAGEAPNDYMDERNSALDQISSLIDCEIYERDDGMHDVISNGVYLVFRDEAKQLVTTQTAESGLFHKAFVVMGDGNPPVLQEMAFGQCKIKGLLESRGEIADMLDLNLENPPFDSANPLNSTVKEYVQFARGSITNGSPNTKADIVIAIDLSDASSEYLDRIKTGIDGYVDGLLKKGLDFNIKLVAFDGASGSAATVGQYTNKNQIPATAQDLNQFIADVLALQPSSAAGAAGCDFGGLVAELEALGGSGGASAFREDASRYAIVFTGDAMDDDGSGGAGISLAAARAYADRLNAIGVSLSAVTPGEAQHSGSGSATAPFGWSAITDATGGAAIAYDEVSGNELVIRDFAGVMQDANDFVNRSVGDRMSAIPASMQILPDARRRLNALVNIVCRSVNELHRSGRTLETPPQDGEDFFVPINAKYPLELGNIQINPKFLEPSGLNYIVSSTSGATEDNNVALAIANLRNEPDTIKTAEGGVTFDDYYRDALYAISTKASESERYLGSQLTVTSSLDQMRHAIMDVSMDEELSNMMKFKFGYDAASRVLNVIDGMIETIVTRLGIVGR